MAKAKQTPKKSSALKGLKMVGGAAAGAAAGSLAGPLGAAVGAVVGGVAGASADEISASKPAQRLASATKKGLHRVVTKSRARKALTHARVTSAARKTPANSGSRKRKH
jgi:outer membrane lipoprotein SlyB